MHETMRLSSRLRPAAGPLGSLLLESLRSHARKQPAAEAVGEVGGANLRCSFLELAELISARAQRLVENVAPGEVVAVILPTGIEYVSWFCAAIAAGVRLLPMHTQIAGPEALAAAGRANAVAAVITPGSASASALAHLALRDNRDSPRAPSEVGVLRDRAGAVVLGSSGTLGLPKLAVRESSSLDADAAAVISGMGLTPQDRVVFATPLSHSYGVDVLVAALTAGATLRVLTSFDAELLAQELNGGATVLPGVPFIFDALGRRQGRQRVALRLAVSAGSPLPDRVRQGFHQAWGVDVGQLFGATELGTVAMDVPGSDGFEPGSVGRPLAGVSMRVVDIDDLQRMVSVGEEGELAVRAPSMLSRYLDGEVPMVDGHFLTGDLARIDAGGRVWVTGRLKTLIDVGTYKVNPLEVEAVLSSHQDVAECLVVPLAVSDTVHRIRALVVPQDPAHPPAAEMLRRFLRERIAPIKVPRAFDMVEALPRSPTGKVLRGRV